jgi:hypothetical protein
VSVKEEKREREKKNKNKISIKERRKTWFEISQYSETTL